MLKYLKSKGYKNVISTNMYIIAEGELPICLCAHMDTVFLFAPKDIYFDAEQKIMWSPQGLGADDRAGIYCIINLLEKGFKPSIILTDLEEYGGKGADALVLKYPNCPFKDCRALIQLDRQGEKDSVFYECDNVDFENKINSYGFKTDFGSFTDISILAPKWGIAAVNLSVGYKNEHQYIEVLNLEYCHKTIEKVSKILKDCKEWNFYEYIPLVCLNPFSFYTNPENKDQEPWWISQTCKYCGKQLEVDEGYLIESKNKNPYEEFLICDDCYKKDAK